MKHFILNKVSHQMLYFSLFFGQKLQVPVLIFAE